MTHEIYERGRLLRSMVAGDMRPHCLPLDEMEYTTMPQTGNQSEGPLGISRRSDR
jgi:fructose 1,6-bisphosphatase